MKNSLDLTGQVFGRWTVRRIDSETKANGNTMWWCRCECGTERSVDCNSLLNGSSVSCGCYRSEQLSETRSVHGYTSKMKSRRGFAATTGVTLEYVMWNSAKTRARKFGLPFDIAVEDVVIPKMCPVLGIKLMPGTGKVCDSSPSLDKIKPALGYVKGNVRVISFRANTIKAGRTQEELEKELSAFTSSLQGDVCEQLISSC